MTVRAWRRWARDKRRAYEDRLFARLCAALPTPPPVHLVGDAPIEDLGDGDYRITAIAMDGSVYAYLMGSLANGEYVRPQLGPSAVTRLIAQGLRQVRDYCQDHHEPIGYLVTYVNKDGLRGSICDVLDDIGPVLVTHP